LNFTLALLGGLVLVAPGLAALVFWQLRPADDGVRRSDIPLTSANAILLILAVSAIAHLLGWALAEAVRGAGLELGALIRPDQRLGPPFENPYDAVTRLAQEKKGASFAEILAFCAVVAAEGVLAAALVASRGLSIFLAGADLGNQGWVFQHIMRPTRFGLKPIAFVLTHPGGSAAGLAYRGVIVEARQSADGDLKGVTLADPEAFAYEVNTPETDQADTELRISTTTRRPLVGVLSIEAAQIRNILVQTIPDDVLDDIAGIDEAGVAEDQAVVSSGTSDGEGEA